MNVRDHIGWTLIIGIVLIAMGVSFAAGLATPRRGEYSGLDAGFYALCIAGVASLALVPSVIVVWRRSKPQAMAEWLAIIIGLMLAGLALAILLGLTCVSAGIGHQSH